MTEKSSWKDRLFGGFSKTSSRLTENLAGLVTKAKLDEATLDDIEDALILSDLGPATASTIREKLAVERFEKGLTEHAVKEIIK
ncbi:signal recognition particle receptor subunit alpha, partial [Parasphingorhabdus sp.]|uniref:signal recognition particle receptor subunit alpha n=1 Tax=Parasphingorhabdus sp. TaxID=2709688 RepID=UPI0030016991